VARLQLVEQDDYDPVAEAISRHWYPVMLVLTFSLMTEASPAGDADQCYQDLPYLLIAGNSSSDL
jgi:hypothetical protein